jgi:riboflavin biosynthesis pyrimidine reductase
MRRVLPSSADDIDPYEEYALAPKQVHVRINFVASADGASTLAGRSGGLSGDADKKLFSILRDLADVILVGASTVRHEGYGPVQLSGDRRDRRRACGLDSPAPIAVVSHSLDLDPAAPIFTEAEARTVVVTDESAPADRREALSAVADIVLAGTDRVDAAEAADRVDELCLTLSPLLAGPGPGRIVRGMPLVEPLGLSLAGLLEQDDFLFLRYDRAHT